MLLLRRLRGLPVNDYVIIHFYCPIKLSGLQYYYYICTDASLQGGIIDDC